MRKSSFGVKLVQKLAWLGVSDMETIELREILLSYGLEQGDATELKITLQNSSRSGTGEAYSSAYRWENSYEVIFVEAQDEDSINCILLEDDEKAAP